MLGVEIVPALVARLIAGAVMEGPVYLQEGAEGASQAEHLPDLGTAVRSAGRGGVAPVPRRLSVQAHRHRNPWRRA